VEAGAAVEALLASAAVTLETLLEALAAVAAFAVAAVLLLFEACVVAAVEAARYACSLEVVD
jgi:hypothetical protein